MTKIETLKHDLEVVDALLEVDKKLTSKYITKSVSMIKAHKGQIQVNDLAKAVGVSRQSIHIAFKGALGVGVKKYIRMVRFMYAHEYLAKAFKLLGNGVNWKFSAKHLGFFDHAHLIREFNSFTGFPPGQYFKAMA